MIEELRNFVNLLFDTDEERTRRLINKLPPTDIEEVERDILIRYFCQTAFLFISEDVYEVEGRGCVCEGNVLLGRIAQNDEVTIIKNDCTIVKTKVTAIVMFKKLLDQAEAGDNCGLLFDNLSGDDLSGSYIILKTADYSSLRNPIIGGYVEDYELEYLNEYREMLSEGQISERDRRYLEKIKESNGISAERADELEKMA